MPPKLLTKSRYLNGLQCPKLLWLLFHEPEKIPEPGAVTQYIFDQGHLVGELARQLFPHGIALSEEDFIGNIRQTRELLKQRKTIFEAGISTQNTYARVDILNPAGVDEWDIIEVKSSTRVKDIDIHDVSFQRFCCQQFGLEISKCYLMHINSEYVRHGEIEPEQLFVMEDITDAVTDISKGILDRIESMFEVISATRCPDVTIGKQCSYPYECSLAECWAFLPENSVFELYRGGQKSLNLLSRGIVSIRDIPVDFKLDGKQQIQRQCILSGQPYIDKAGIGKFLSTLQYPLQYLDFETFSTAIPMFDGTRPYQNIPFQFSLHTIVDGESEPEHLSFLAEGTGDPRPELLSELEKAIGDKGSIVVYNQSFEKSILGELGNAFPEYRPWVENLLTRIVDLLTPFKSFHYYHPLQGGSASLKKVLPAITGKSYEGMGIENGENASLAFLQITYGDVSEETATKVRLDLETYCKLDTEGMVCIVERLKELV